jgi:hypothetical protein
MSSVRRILFVALPALTILLIICVLYSDSQLSRLSIVTTVHSYIHTGTLTSLKTDSNVKEDLNGIHRLKTSLEDLIKQYSENQSHNSTSMAMKNKSLSDFLFSNQQLTGKNEDNQNRASAVIRPSQSTMVADVELSEIMSLTRGHTTREPLTTGTTEARHNIQNVHEGLSRNESDTDLLVRSLLLKALMNETAESDTNKTKSLPIIDEALFAKPGCTNVGKFPSEESKSIWLNFKRTLETYTNFHREQLQKLKAGNSSIRTLTWSCHDPVQCAGIGDQFYRIQQVLILAIASDRVLSLHWNPSSYETTKYLQPNKIDWAYFNKTQGMHEYHESELSKAKVMDTAKEFEVLYKLLSSRTHVTVNHELQVPFLRGMFKAIRTNTGMSEAIKKTGFAALIMDKKHGMPMNFLSGKLLRYLFHFRGTVVDKVDQIQQQLGIADKPYLALHIRTGFLGMKQEEVGHFNSEKIYRNPSDWEKSLTCSVKLAGRLFGPETPLFLATDSSRVKEMAIEKYKERFVMINVTLQHVAFTEKEKKMEKSKVEENAKSSLAESTPVTADPILNIGGVDGYMATWIEFLLLARASGMVHSISGFSSTAAQFCSMQNQYHEPNCK